MTMTSWLKYEHEIKKMIVYINVMLTHVNNIKKNCTNLIKLFNFEILSFCSSLKILSNNIWEYNLNKYIYNSSKKKLCEYACFPLYF